VKNTDRLNSEMENISNKMRKTRRGKKGGCKERATTDIGRPVGDKGNGDVAHTSSVRFHPFSCSSQTNKRWVRPRSPKAPHNSTQYIIHDSGNDDIKFVENIPCEPITSPFQAMDIDDARCQAFDYSGESFYSDDMPEPDGCADYCLISEDQTNDFIAREFEREFQNEQESCYNEPTPRSSVKDSLTKMPKYELVQHIIKMQNRLSERSLDNADDSRQSLKNKIMKLKQQNLQLICENEEIQINHTLSTY